MTTLWMKLRPDTMHPSKVDVDKFMRDINVLINLRLESDRRSRSIYRRWRTSQETLVSGAKLRKESDELLKEAEYTLYELIDNALEQRS